MLEFGPVSKGHEFRLGETRDTPRRGVTRNFKIARITIRELGEYRVLYDAIHALGGPGAPPVSEDSVEDWAKKAARTISMEETRANRVTRTFTKHGFDKAALPWSCGVPTEVFEC